MFAAYSLVLLVRGVPTEDMVSTAALLRLVALELLMLAWWVPRLARGGWTLSCVTLPFSSRDLARGVVLWVAALLTYWLTWIAFALTLPGIIHAATQVRIGGSAAWWSVILLSIVNPVAEELLYLGFIANSLRAQPYSFVLGASLLVRLCVHLYQGPLVAVAILPLGLVFTSYYLSTYRIWPVVIAHAVLDAHALLTTAP